MKLRLLASLSVAVVIGCSQSPTHSPSPVSDASPDVEISIPEVPSESTADTEAAANETLVSLSVPGMQ
ncbi:MAG: hypothetical protein H6822_09680 [Planctomycetaceae bacterium]|nr:hypothetical protein [Planctomycetales bacterium]MCB9922440.1 hypothetical protein [Planctomycetaceae bacterium]